MFEGTASTPVKKKKEAVLFVKRTVDYYAFREAVAYLWSYCPFRFTQRPALLASQVFGSVQGR